MTTSVTCDDMNAKISILMTFLRNTYIDIERFFCNVGASITFLGIV